MFIPVPAPLPPDESDRLAELRSMDVLDTLPEQAYDDLARLAAQICGAPIAMMTLIDEDRQWIKARMGVVNAAANRQEAICAHTILEDRLLIVPDLRADPRFCDNALVTGDLKVRFYAGAPLRMSSGHLLGSLCVLDRTPRTLTRDQQESLRALSRQVVAQMELKRTVQELERTTAAQWVADLALKKSERRFQAFMNNGPVIAYIKDSEGRFLYVNEPCASRFGIPVEQWLDRTDADLFGAEIAGPLRQHDLTALASESGISVEEEAPTAEGGMRHWISHKFALRDPEGRNQLAGLSLDITDRKQAEHEREEMLQDLRQALIEVKTLSGLLPVCASCKSIRNDAGYWQKMEAYLAEHSEVEFTHGLCPHCVEKLYPDFAKARGAEYS